MIKCGSQQQWQDRYHSMTAEKIVVISATLLILSDQLSMEFYFPPSFQPNSLPTSTQFELFFLIEKNGSGQWNRIIFSTRNPNFPCYHRRVECCGLENTLWKSIDSNDFQSTMLDDAPQLPNTSSSCQSSCSLKKKRKPRDFCPPFYIFKNGHARNNGKVIK